MMKAEEARLRVKWLLAEPLRYMRQVADVYNRWIEKTLANNYVKTGLFLLAIVGFAFLFGKRIAVGHLRTVIIFSIFFLLAAASVNLKSGITVLVLYLPLMAFIRRYIYVYGRYVAMDPILIISDVITIWMFGYLLIFKRKEIYKQFRENKLVRFATMLLFIFVVQIFNPNQGGILVGIGGAKFYIIPFLWFYFGLFLDRKFIKRLLIFVVIIGAFTALYGMKQTFFGFTSFEKYWIEYGGYSALHLFRIIRSFSTFASAGEYSHFLTIAGIICLAFLMKQRNKLLYLCAMGAIVTSLFISAVRTSILTFVLSSVFIITFLVQDKRKGLLLSCLLLGAGILFISRIGFLPQADEFDPISVTSYHALRGIMKPLQEASFKSRLWVWTQNFPKMFIKNPLGYGLGTSTLAAWKFGSRFVATENIFLDIVLSTGILGAVLFCVVLSYIIRFSIIIVRRKGDLFMGVLIITLTIAFFFIGNASEYTISPLMWLLWGFVAAQVYAIKRNNSQG